MKKLLKIVFVVILLLLIAAIALPYLFKGKIVALVKKEINDKVNAKVDFTNVDISLLSHFPKLSVSVDGLKVTGNDVFANDTLIAAKSLGVTVNIMSFITGKQMEINSVFIESPRIHAIVNKDGLTNWNILKDTTTATAGTSASKPFKLQLQKYAIHNGYISYIDQKAHISSEIVNLNHDGKGDFSTDLFTLKTGTTADEITLVYDGIPFLAKIKAVINIDLDINNQSATYTFNTDQISVNDLKVSGSGSVTSLNGKGYALDIKFKSPSTEFKNILSLIPSLYKKDFASIKTSGTMAFDGFLKGIFSDKQMPAYHINMQVNNGFFQYPDLPKAIKNINIIASVDDVDGQPDNNIIDVQKAHLEIDNNPFDCRILIKKPISDMYVDAAAKGKLDFSQVAQFVKLEAGTTLTGILNADVFAKGNVSAIEKKQFDKFAAGGIMGLTNFVYTSKDYPSGIKINTLATSFTASQIIVSTMNGQYLSTNFKGNGQINNLLNYILQNKPLNATLTVNADNVNLNELMGTSADTTTQSTTASSPFVVPANLDIILNTKVDKLHYNNLDILNLSGTTKISDETASLNNVKGNALDGTITINGTYSTKISKVKPAIAFDYNVDNVDIQKTFTTFNTVQKIMPIAKFMNGKMSSQLSVNGAMVNSMMPDINTLTGKGKLLLSDAVLTKFGPLEKIATTLNIGGLQQVPLKNVNVLFEFANGKLQVDPFNVKVANINMKVAGQQGFDQSMDYAIAMKVPRSMMGAGANELVNNLVGQLNSNGVAIKVADSIPVNCKLGGTFTNPTVKADFNQGSTNTVGGAKQQVKDFVQTQIDSVKKQVANTLKDTIASVKKQAVALAKAELLKQLSGNTSTDSTQPKTNLEQSAKGVLKGLFKKKSN